MSNFTETLDDVENFFLANPEDGSLIAGTLIELDNLIESTNDEINPGLLNALKKCLKQKLDNSKHKTITWKRHMSNYEKCSRPQIMTNKDILKHLTSIGLKNADITKKINMCRILVSQCIKLFGLTDVLKESEDDNEITQTLSEVN